MLSLKRYIIISALLGVVVGVLADGWLEVLVAAAALAAALALVDRWTMPDQDPELGLLQDEVEQPMGEAPEPPPTPKTASLR